MEMIVIDLEKMTCIGKLKTMDDAIALAEVCLPSNVAYAIQPFDDCPCFNGYTHLELKLLLKNTCGKLYSEYHLNQLQVIAVELFTNMQTLDYDLHSLNAQQKWKENVCKDKSVRYDYVKGAIVPKLAGDGCLFQTCEEIDNASQKAKDWYRIRNELKAKNIENLKPLISRISEGNFNSTLPQHNSETRQPRENTPKIGSSRDTIWKVADELWENIGKSTDIKEVLKMRKEAMNKLESEYGVKKTSSSNELGKWQKDRIPA